MKNLHVESSSIKRKRMLKRRTSASRRISKFFEKNSTKASWNLFLPKGKYKNWLSNNFKFFNSLFPVDQAASVKLKI